ncbi:SAV_915 family protein [Knoellia sp. S7-12]|uniref:SAV_915 family protein n=1 Tax=Knoellia sp. S7-12 TaxID=3126698 RepID=UPI003367E3AB
MSDQPQTPQAPPVPPMPAPAPETAPAPRVGESSEAADREQAVKEHLASFPPVVYVPTTDEAEPAQRHIILHTLQDGRTALFVYSAPDRLRDMYLPDASWVLCDGAQLQKVQEQTPFDLLFLDIDPDLRDEKG